MLAAKFAPVAARAASTKFQAGQTSTTNANGQEVGGVQNGYGGKTLAIQNYYESESGSAKQTAIELEWLARARG
jgi:hypothetical protein